MRKNTPSKVVMVVVVAVGVKGGGYFALAVFSVRM